MMRHISKILLLTVLLVAGLLAVAFAPLFGSHAQEAPSSGPPPLFQPAPVPGLRVPRSQEEIRLSFAPLVSRVAPSVVNVYTTRSLSEGERAMAQMRRGFSRFGGMAPSRVNNSLGSGVIVGEDGTIVTNAHVVAGADAFRVVLSDRREYEAELILADERTDLAVLKIDEPVRLPALDYADTRATLVGDLVLAIGNPFGVGQTVTQGIISATARTDVGVSDYAFFLQTDAAVNPGNSGGALVNAAGQLVGVNTAIFSRSGGSNGIGFAIPAEMVRRVVDAAVNEGMLIRPWLGLKGQTVDFDIARAQGLSRPVGVIVTDVFDDGPAARAGLRRGDIVTAFDGREVFDERGLGFLAATLSPGDTAQLSVRRSGAERTVTVRVAAPPGAAEDELVILDGPHPLYGAMVAMMSPRLADELGLDPFLEGALVTRIAPRALAWRTVRPGTVITAVNGRAIEDADDLREALARPRRGGIWVFDLEYNGRKGRVERRL